MLKKKKAKIQTENQTSVMPQLTKSHENFPLATKIHLVTVCVCEFQSCPATLDHVNIWTSSAVNTFPRDTLLLFLTGRATVLYIQWR